MKKVLVTGGAGFIGSQVVRELLNRNVEVRAMLRPGESEKNIKGLGVEIVSGDILDKKFVLQSVRDIDTVFHLAAIYSIWMPDWKLLYEVNLQGSRNILWSCLKTGVKKVVYTSSIAALGIEEGTKLSNEDSEFNQYVSNPYVLSKYLSQQEALGFAENGLNLVVVNPTFPFGPGDQGPTPTGKMLLDVIKGYNPFRLNAGFNVVDVRDVALGHVLAAEKGKCGEKYILGNKNITIDQFCQYVEEAAHLKLRRIPISIPTPVMLGATSLLTWFSDHVTHKPPISTPADVKYISQYLYFDNTKACRDLGFSPRGVRESISDSIKWYKDNHYV
ncbi:SDR family oxidoreductase [Deltaproteobacteria bacterium TL4]